MHGVGAIAAANILAAANFVAANSPAVNATGAAAASPRGRTPAHLPAKEWAQLAIRCPVEGCTHEVAPAATNRSTAELEDLCSTLRRFGQRE